MDAETRVKQRIYETLAGTGLAPSSADVAKALGMPLGEVQAAFAALHARRLLVPEPGDPGRIRMAPPFSGIKTAFAVHARDVMYFANCVWDAYGIPAALHADARIDAVDGHTGEPLPLEVRAGAPAPRPYFAHFAVPAARWWEDIVYT